MISMLWSAILSFFVAMLIAATLQNVALVRSFGISRLISLIDDAVSMLIYGIMLTISMTLSGVFYYLCNQYLLPLLPETTRRLLRPMGLILCMALAFIVVFVLSVKFAPYQHISAVVSALPVATFNCTVVGILLIASSATTGYTLFDTIGFCIGSGIGFVLAVLLVTEGQRCLQNRRIPSAFKGLPATLLFLAGLAMAVYGLTGFRFVF